MEIFIGIVILVIIVALFSQGSSCYVCDLPIKKKSYRWDLDGKRRTLCPKCNSQMERKISKEAFKNKFG
ncbi:MAG: hypothetical protein KAJ07_00865 [Planctomycetes bacterium]|nr:hypothetical protein [Planctomycetota bacterium]